MNSNTLKIILVISLLVNAIAFTYVGKTLALCHMPTLPRHRIDVHELVYLLSESKQRTLEPAIAQFDQDDKRLANRLTEERKKLVALVQATPFDEKAFLAQIKVLDGVKLQSSKNITSLVDKITVQASDAERQKIAAKLSDMLIDKQK